MSLIYDLNRYFLFFTVQWPDAFLVRIADDVSLQVLGTHVLAAFLVGNLIDSFEQE